MTSRQPTVDDVTTTNTLEVWRDKLTRETRCALHPPTRSLHRQSAVYGTSRD